MKLLTFGPAADHDLSRAAPQERHDEALDPYLMEYRRSREEELPGPEQLDLEL